MMRIPAPLLATFVLVAAVSCSKKEGPSPAGTAGSAPAASADKGGSDQRVAKIPILAGYKYYVGGPLLKQDAYGRPRIVSFNGEVEQPPGRGIVFGVKKDGDNLEYRVWGNGVLVAVHRGVMREGLYWDTYVENYREEKLVARESSEFDDAAKEVKISAEDIDPEKGEVIRKRVLKMSYLPAPVPADVTKELDEGQDDDDDGSMVPAGGAKAPAAPAAAPAAPAAKAPDAPK
jgi:hypothetical protein